MARTYARAEIIVSVLAACAVTGCGARAARPAGPRPDTLRVERVAAGVTHEYRWYAAGPWAVHAVTIDPRACGLQFRTIKGRDRVVGRETTSALATRAAATLGRPVLTAINADFFSFEPPGVSEGPQVANGVLVKSEGTHREATEDRIVRLRPVVAFTADGRAHISHTQLRGSVVARAFSVPLAGVNVRPHSDDAYAFDALYGDVTPADTGSLEIVLREVMAPASGFQRIGVVTGTDTLPAGTSIPRDGFVVATRGAGRMLGTLAAGDTIRMHAAFDSLPANVVEMIGGYPMLLVNGQPVHHQETGLRSPFADRRHPRAAIGTDRKGNVQLIAVDGRQAGYSDGMSLEELSAYLLAHGITNAMNFDGGGSTTLVVSGRIANRPSDQTGERPVANALLLLGPPPGACR